MDKIAKQRWRLALGRFAEKHLSSSELSFRQQEQDEVLNQLYQMHLERKGMRGSGTLDDSQVTAMQWLTRVDKLFPKSVAKSIQLDATSTFGLTSILKDKSVLQSLEPNIALLNQLMSIKTELNSELLVEVRRIIEGVVDQLLAQMKPKFQNRLSGRLNRHQSSPIPIMANLDWKKTIKENLKHYDQQTQQLILERIHFSSRSKKHLPWHVMLCIDQSGSMMESMIYSAVIAGILNRLPTVDLKLILFDTNVVDMSDRANNPVEVLLSCQLGGGTLINRAWQYCETLLTEPKKTILITVSDFDEGGSPGALVQTAKHLTQMGVKTLGIAAMTADALPFYNNTITSKLATAGMELGTYTPDALADWLAKHMEF